MQNHDRTAPGTTYSPAPRRGLIEAAGPRVVTEIETVYSPAPRRGLIEANLQIANTLSTAAYSPAPRRGLIEADRRRSHQPPPFCLFPGTTPGPHCSRSIVAIPPPSILTIPRDHAGAALKRVDSSHSSTVYSDYSPAPRRGLIEAGR